MAVGFIRRFSDDPGLAVLTAIEGVVVIDRDPPAVITGVGTGTVTIVAEFEDGAFNTPLQLSGGGDFLNTFGGFGYTYNGVASQNPCARKRSADAALTPEAWNGNGFIAAQGKKFAALICCRVDTSVGSVTFTREASLHGAGPLTWALVSGQHLDLDVGGGTVVTTFTGVPAHLASASGTYPSTFAGGESITFSVDGTTYQAFFQVGDQSQAQVLARMNLVAGFTAFAQGSGTVTNLNGLLAGTSGEVQILAVSSGLVTTATGFSVGGSPTAGTGNVANIVAVQDSEVDSLVHTDVAALHFFRDANGDAWLVNTGTPGTGTVKVVSTTTATEFGFPVGVVDSAASGNVGTIPAGTPVTDGTHTWVTMQTVAVKAATAGPYTVKVRPANDDGTGVSAIAGAVNAVPTTNPIALDAFSVANLAPLTAALTEAQIDVAYITALGTTKATSSVVKRTNKIVCARASNAIRNALRSNADDASANGCYGRMAILRPPLGTTTRAQALSLNSQPGVGAYRDQRVIYAFPGVQCYVPQIAALGAVAGGFGFTDTGLVDTGFDTWVASVTSQLPPEENPGQATTFLQGILAVEAGNPDVQALTIGDYENFRAGGIAAPRVDEGVSFVQSGITSVDPLVYPNLKNIARRQMADYIQDTLSLRLMSYDKKLATLLRRALIVSEITAFMDSLVSAKNPSLQRIDSYSIDAKSGNTPDTLAAGVFRIILKVRTLSSLDVIVLDTQIGESVIVSEAA